MNTRIFSHWHEQDDTYVWHIHEDCIARPNISWMIGLQDGASVVGQSADFVALTETGELLNAWMSSDEVKVDISNICQNTPLSEALARVPDDVSEIRMRVAKEGPKGLRNIGKNGPAVENKSIRELIGDASSALSEICDIFDRNQVRVTDVNGVEEIQSQVSYIEYELLSRVMKRVDAMAPILARPNITS